MAGSNGRHPVDPARSGTMRNVTTAWQWRFSCDPPGRRIGFTAAGRGRMRIRARGSGRQTRVRGLSEDPGSIGFAVPNMRLRAAWHASLARRTREYKHEPQ
ncbi:hypothetical protein JCM4914_46820 [Streptomyces platensis subsp. malvinus]